MIKSKVESIMIDAHGLWHRAKAKGSDAPYWFFDQAFRFRDMFSGKLFLIADNNDSGWKFRANEYPEYKKGRESQDYSVLDKIIALALCLPDDIEGVYQCMGFEADDVVFLAHKEQPKPIALISDDRDWDRLLDRNTLRMNFHGEVTTYDSFQKEHGFAPSVEAVSFYKAIRGDASDNIRSSIPRLKTPYLLKAIENFKGDNPIQALRDAGVNPTAIQSRDIVRNLKVIMPRIPSSDYYTESVKGSASSLCLSYGWDYKKIHCKTKISGFFA